MHLLDWIFFALPLLLVLGIAFYTQRYMQSVSDFMSSGRLAGRYLLAVAKGELQSGAVVFVAGFELIAQAGFNLSWWSWLTVPIGLIVATSGFVLYRFRETRALTLAQFFELRYSKKFRLFTGMLGFLAGILNFGIIPAVGARVFVYFLGLPEQVKLLSVSVPSYVLVMAVSLSITLSITLSGGLITIMVTDCLEGIFSQLFYLVIIAALVVKFPWRDISDVLLARAAGHSLVNPFDAGKVADFNVWYLMIAAFVSVYGTMAWQNGSAYNSAALTPHESRMGGVLGRWREMGKGAVVTLLGICAMTFLQHPHYALEAASAHRAIASITQPQIRQQMASTVALAHCLPPGVTGILCAVFLMGIFGGDSTHLHSWGGIFVQDVLVPLLKKPFGPAQHIRALRLSIAGVALFAFLFGAFFRQTEYILMWWSITTAVYVGGAGAAIIGGLYWKKGTAAGAWSAMLCGSILSGGGILAREIYGQRVPLNGQQISFAATLVAIAVYVGVSLLTYRGDFNLERMLHRGKYAANAEAVDDPARPSHAAHWSRLIGIDEDFSRGDKWIAGALFGWSLLWFGVVLGGTLWNLVNPWPVRIWIAYWQWVGVGIPVAMAAVTAVWFTWGGMGDMRNLFRRLKSHAVNHLDDGTVIDHQNLGE